MQTGFPGRRTTRLAIGALLALLATGSAAAATEIHRWVDENGVVHFSDVRPANLPSSSVEIDAPATDPTPAATAQSPSAAAAAEQPESAAEARRRAIRERREAQAAERAETEFWCDKHRKRLEQMEPARRVYYTDENGQQVRMDDDMRIGLVEESRAFLSENCQ